MIVRTDPSLYWAVLDDPTDCPVPEVFSAPAHRVSALLGPDGEPLLVPFPRPKIGFDLTPKRKT